MFNVLSFDSEKILLTSTLDGRRIVKKKTSEDEYVNIKLAQQHLLKRRPTIVSDRYGEIKILVAQVVDWEKESKVLSTLFCPGENFEETLRKTIGTERGSLLELIGKLFVSFKTNGFLWGDFAPRNMIWDQSTATIWLVDFERSLNLKNCRVTDQSFNRYVRNYSREEFSCFLTHAEQESIFVDFVEEVVMVSIPSTQITSKRRRALLERLVGQKNRYSLTEVREAEDIMVSVATPILVRDTFLFPMDTLDRIATRGGPHEYARIVMLSRESEKISHLKRCTALV